MLMIKSNFLPNCFIIQYADDTQILIEGDIANIDDLIKRAEDILKQAKIYFLHNGLLLNERKTQCIFIGSRQYISQIDVDISLNINGNIIQPLKTVKNLGVHFDQYMTFDKHIDKVYSKVMGTLIYLNRLKDSFEPETRLIVIQSLALSIIDYCFKVWGLACNLHLNRVQKLQNFAARVANGNIRKYEHISPYLKELQWIKIKDKYTYDICIMVFKVLRKCFPEWLYIFNNISSVHGINTRQSNNLIVQRANTELGSRQMHVKGPYLWNKLPETIRDATSLSSFKGKLRRHILEST